MNTEHDFQDIFDHFEIEGELLDCERYGQGLINETYCMTVKQKGGTVRYILQCINNRLFKDVDKLMHNIQLVTEWSRKSVEERGGDPLRECLNLVHTRDGKVYYCDGKNYYRIYIFIEGATAFDYIRDPRDFYECAVAFGNFANLLATFDASQLYEVLPNFHNTKVRYQNFLNAVEKDVCGRRKEVQDEKDVLRALREKKKELLRISSAE